MRGSNSSLRPRATADARKMSLGGAIPALTRCRSKVRVARPCCRISVVTPGGGTGDASASTINARSATSNFEIAVESEARTAASTAETREELRRAARRSGRSSASTATTSIGVTLLVIDKIRLITARSQRVQRITSAPASSAVATRISQANSESPGSNTRMPPGDLESSSTAEGIVLAKTIPNRAHMGSESRRIASSRTNATTRSPYRVALLTVICSVTRNLLRYFHPRLSGLADSRTVCGHQCERKLAQKCFTHYVTIKGGARNCGGRRDMVSSIDRSSILPNLRCVSARSSSVRLVTSISVRGRSRRLRTTAARSSACKLEHRWLVSIHLAGRIGLS